MGKSKFLKMMLVGMLIAIPAGIHAQTFERGLLFELFTGQECSGCPGGTSALVEMFKGMEDNNRIVWMSHHAGYLHDSLTVRESADLANFLGVYEAPILIYNRSLQTLRSKKERLLLKASEFREYNSLHAQYDPEGRTYIEAQLDEPADISVDIDVTYDKATRTMAARVYGQRGAGFEASSPAVSVWLTQDIYVGYQDRGSMNYDYAYQHHNPVRLSLSEDYLGDKIEFAEDGTWELTYECQIPEEVEPYDAYGTIVNARVPVDDTQMHVAAFVYNRDETTPSGENGRETIGVFNAVRCKLGNNSTSAVVAPVADGGMVRAYAVGGRIVVEGDYDTFNVYTLAGQMVDGDNLPRGIYLVRVMSDGIGRTVKVMVS